MMKEESSVDVVYNFIVSEIENRTIFPGNRIIEEDIAKKTGVSRISVRAALTRLRYEGYVDSSPNRSSCLVNPVNDIAQVQEARWVLESTAMRLSMNNISEEALAAAADCIERHRAIVNRFSLAEYVKINRDFHSALISGCKNEYFKKFLNELYNKYGVYLMFFDNSRDGSMSTHQTMLDAMREKDEQKLLSALRRDLELVRTER